MGNGSFIQLIAVPLEFSSSAPYWLSSSTIIPFSSCWSSTIVPAMARIAGFVSFRLR